MMRGVSLDWLRTVCAEGAGEKILLSPSFGLELAFFPSCTTLEICSSDDVEKEWARLLIASMENLKRTGLETLLGLNKAGRRVFLYHQLRGILEHDTRKYWDRCEKRIRVGMLIEEDLERTLTRVRYPHSVIRWNLFGQMMVSRWLERQKKRELSPQTIFHRLNTRKESMWCLPWRYEHVLSDLPEHQKKSILPKIGNVLICEQTITERIQNAEESSIDVFLLWDAVEALEDLWPSIQRAGTKNAFVLIASKEDEPSWWNSLADHVISHTSDTHFSFGRVSWLGVCPKTEI